MHTLKLSKNGINHAKKKLEIPEQWWYREIFTYLATLTQLRHEQVFQ